MDSLAANMISQTVLIHPSVVVELYQILRQFLTQSTTAFGVLQATMWISSVTQGIKLRLLLQENWDSRRKVLKRRQRREIWHLPSRFMQHYCVMSGFNVPMLWLLKKLRHHAPGP